MEAIAVLLTDLGAHNWAVEIARSSKAASGTAESKIPAAAASAREKRLPKIPTSLTSLCPTILDLNHAKIV